MARKRDESREIGRKQKRHSQKSDKRHGHDSKEVDVESLKSQLAVLGLSLREVPGDGNCLFRALGDQLEGHMGNHYRLRQDTTNYMRDHREDFQPFVEDNVPFEKHVSELSKLGTYAGNDAIVAFARLHQVVVVIHQPNAPVWQIKGWEVTAPELYSVEKKKTIKNNVKQLHIAYHGGDHYDSVRKIGDTSHLPGNIALNIDSNSNGEACEMPTAREDGYGLYENPSCEIEQNTEDINSLEVEAVERSGCQDLNLVRELLDINHGNLDATVEDLIEIRFKWSSEASCSAVSKPTTQQSQEGCKGRGNLNKKQLEKIRKHERKRASENRKKSQRAEEFSDETVILGKVQCLNI